MEDILEYLRGLEYDPLEWEDRVEDEDTGEVLVEGTPVNEVNLNRLEAGMLVALMDIGLNSQEVQSTVSDILLELDKNKKQRFLKGTETIIGDDGDYFNDEYPYVLVDIPEDAYPQLNAPDYNVMITVLEADDFGKVGELVPFDKAQNGFKVKMTGSAEEVTFMWALYNPDIS